MKEVRIIIQSNMPNEAVEQALEMVNSQISAMLPAFILRVISYTVQDVEVIDAVATEIVEPVRELPPELKEMLRGLVAE